MKKLSIKHLFLKMQDYLSLMIINIKGLISLESLIFIFLSVGILLLGFIYNTGIFGDINDIYMYFESSFLLLIIITAIFTIFFTAFNNDIEYNMIVARGRGYTLVIKICSRILLISAVYLFFIGLLLFIPSIFIKGMIIDKNIFYGILYIYLSIIILMLSVMLVSIIVDSKYIALFFIVLYIISFIMGQNYIKMTPLLSIMQYILPIPILKNGNIILIHKIDYHFIYLFTELFLLKKLYFNKDLS